MGKAVGENGKDGANGNDGQNGTNGVDGKDGHTPQIGVKQDADGIYYWIVDGEWLLDDNGNKIKAVGKDGQDGQDGANGNDGQNGTNGTDGITPELKIENGYWYVSYDDGATWKQLGKATGEDGQDGINGTDGKDGQDGDSFFQSVTEDENNVYITLTDGSVFTLPKTSCYLFNRLQSITYIPKYSDGKVCVKDGIAELDFQVSPKDAVKEIAKNWESILKAKSIYTITRAVSFIDMPILSCEADEANGVISITVSDDNLSEDFFIGTQSAEIALALSDGNNEITSEYIPISPYHPYNEIWYTSANGEIITPNSTNFGANIVSNTYQNGKGIIRCDGAVTTIGGNAFSDKYRTLLSVILPPSVTTIGNKAFSNCYGLSIVIPKNVTSFGSNPFERCGGVVTVNCNIPSLDTSIFTDFTEAIVGAGVTAIGDNAFYGNQKITKISLPNSLNSIGDEAFYGCVSLVNIVIPDSVTTIGDRAFYKCEGLESISIPDKVSTINEFCFAHCSNLTTVAIGKSVTSIKDDAFYLCKALKSINIPDNVLVIGDYVFRESGLTEAIIGSGITSIGLSSFGCSKIYCKANTPPAISATYDAYDNIYGSFGYKSGNIKIYVPSQAYDLYTQYTSYKLKTNHQANWAIYNDKIVAYDFENNIEVSANNAL